MVIRPVRGAPMSAAMIVVAMPAAVVTAAAAATVIVFRFIAHRKVSYGYENLKRERDGTFFQGDSLQKINIYIVL